MKNLIRQPVRLSAYLLIATGILHNSIGFIFGASTLAAIANDGFINSVAMQFDREAIFWFLFSGFSMMLWGVLMLSLPHIPKVFSWSLLLLSIVGAVMMPVSGFWLVIPQACYMLLQRRSNISVAQTV